jgi:hypothetical protein
MTFLFLRLVLQWLRKRARLAPVGETPAGLVFSARGLKHCYAGFILLSLLFSSLAIVLHEPKWLASLPLLVAIGCVACWPPEIMVNAQGITQREWWGRKWHIAWPDVSAAVYRANNGSTFVYNAGDKTIRHSGCHAASRRFRLEVLRRSGVRQIAEWRSVLSVMPAASSKVAASGRD